MRDEGCKAIVNNTKNLEVLGLYGRYLIINNYRMWDY